MERNTEYALENIFSVIDRRCCSEKTADYYHESFSDKYEAGVGFTEEKNL